MVKQKTTIILFIFFLTNQLLSSDLCDDLDTKEANSFKKAYSYDNKHNSPTTVTFSPPTPPNKSVQPIPSNKSELFEELPQSCAPKTDLCLKKSAREYVSLRLQDSKTFVWDSSSSEIDDTSETDTNSDINYFDDQHGCWMKDVLKVLDNSDTKETNSFNKESPYGNEFESPTTVIHSFSPPLLDQDKPLDRSEIASEIFEKVAKINEDRDQKNQLMDRALTPNDDQAYPADYLSLYLKKSPGGMFLAVGLRLNRRLDPPCVDTTKSSNKLIGKRINIEKLLLRIKNKSSKLIYQKLICEKRSSLKKIIILAHTGIKDLSENISLKKPEKNLKIKKKDIYFISPKDKKLKSDDQYNVIYLCNYSNDAEFHNRVDELRDSFPFTHIVALHENDVMRASRIRKKYNLPGMTTQECLLFRNKLIMIDLIKKEGLAVPESQGIKIFSELKDFVDNKNEKIVLKPVAGVSGKNTWVIENKSSLYRIENELTQFFPSSSTGENHVLVAQEFIDRPMFHVDGYFNKKGKVLWSWPSVYNTPPLSLEKGEIVTTTVLADSAFAHYLNSYAKRILHTMTRDIESSSIFHLEGFYESELKAITDFYGEKLFEKITFCEVACRTGGFTIPKQLEMAFGINLITESIKSEIGIETFKNIPSKPKSAMGVVTPFKPHPESPNKTFVLRGSEKIFSEFLEGIKKIFDNCPHNRTLHKKVPSSNCIGDIKLIAENLHHNCALSEKLYSLAENHLHNRPLLKKAHSM